MYASAFASNSYRFLLVECAIRFVEHRDVFRIEPARSTLAAGVEETQKREWIHVIGAPALRAKILCIPASPALPETSSTPCCASHGDAEILFPLCLHPLGHRFV